MGDSGPLPFQRGVPFLPARFGAGGCTQTCRSGFPSVLALLSPSTPPALVPQMLMLLLFLLRHSTIGSGKISENPRAREMRRAALAGEG